MHPARLARFASPLCLLPFALACSTTTATPDGPAQTAAIDRPASAQAPPDLQAARQDGADQALSSADFVVVHAATAVQESPLLQERRRTHSLAQEPFRMLDEPELRGPRDLVIVAVGDVSQPTEAWVERTQELAEAAFEPTRHLLKSGDLTSMNLENPMTVVAPVAEKQFAYNSPPERLRWYLNAHFNLFSLANNHIADSGQEGLEETIASLNHYAEEAGVDVYYAGAGSTPEAGISPTLIALEDKELTLAFFSVGFSRNPNVGRFWDESLPDRIRDIQDEVDLIIVSAHAGQEYTHVPRDREQRLFRSWIDAGADLIIGHHPHSIQPVEQYKQGLILYSLGNFVFASRTRRHRERGARLYGMLTRVVIHDGALHGAEIVPLWVNNSEDWRLEDGQLMPNANFQPQLLTGTFADHFFDDLARWTEEAGASPIERRGDVGYLRLEPPTAPSIEAGDDGIDDGIHQ